MSPARGPRRPALATTVAVAAAVVAVAAVLWLWLRHEAALSTALPVLGFILTVSGVVTQEWGKR